MYKNGVFGKKEGGLSLKKRGCGGSVQEKKEGPGGYAKREKRGGIALRKGIEFDH